MIRLQIFEWPFSAIVAYFTTLPLLKFFGLTKTPLWHNNAIDIGRIFSLYIFKRAHSDINNGRLINEALMHMELDMEASDDSDKNSVNSDASPPYTHARDQQETALI